MNTSEKILFYPGLLLAAVAILAYGFHLQSADKLILPLIVGTVLLASGQRRCLTRLRQHNQTLEARP
ncbi:hypothetical protein KLP40_06110 [Hymenobacter sp. NST-14]|uniref:hypothetical protein n=1 Tax=Hymenobacter piscis TaxID=2839984 RepID=UPI001C00ABD7|nr:hypothetical protein [Hymenobacter piscis]MBT9392731.1 hypothetical protein [Hymenobacter piscis]